MPTDGLHRPRRKGRASEQPPSPPRDPVLCITCGRTISKTSGSETVDGWQCRFRRSCLEAARQRELVDRLGYKGPCL